MAGKSGFDYRADVYRKLRHTVISSGTGVFRPVKAGNMLRVTLVGGGGSGNAIGSTGSSGISGSGGGAGAAMTIEITAAASHTYIVGAGGPAQNPVGSSTSYSANGGATMFDGYRAGGGTGGSSLGYANGGAGGAGGTSLQPEFSGGGGGGMSASSTCIAYTGSTPGYPLGTNSGAYPRIGGTNVSGTPAYFSGGGGGHSILGTGGDGAYVTSGSQVVAQDGTGFGAGGGGGSSSASATATMRYSGAGSGGVIIIEEYGL